MVFLPCQSNMHHFPSSLTGDITELVTKFLVSSLSFLLFFLQIELINLSSKCQSDDHFPFPVEIVQREKGANFKGFLVQALDAETHHPLGQFVTGNGMQLLKECSAVTHTDPKPKKAVNLVWEAPYDRSGQVIFR